MAALNVFAPKYRLAAGFDRLSAVSECELGAALAGERPADVADGG